MCRAERPRGAGFTLLEVLVVLLVMAVLALVAWPGYQAQRLKARRADAHVALLQLQQHQLRWRADHPAYASAADLAAPLNSPDGHYRLRVVAPGPEGFTLQAEAQGPQGADTPCAVIGLRQHRAHTTLLSQSADGTDTAATPSRSCWPR